MSAIMEKVNVNGEDLDRLREVCREKGISIFEVDKMDKHIRYINEAKLLVVRKGTPFSYIQKFLMVEWHIIIND